MYNIKHKQIIYYKMIYQNKKNKMIFIDKFYKQKETFNVNFNKIKQMI